MLRQGKLSQNCQPCQVNHSDSARFSQIISKLYPKNVRNNNNNNNNNKPIFSWLCYCFTEKKQKNLDRLHPQWSPQEKSVQALWYVVRPGANDPCGGFWEKRHNGKPGGQLAMKPWCKTICKLWNVETTLKCRVFFFFNGSVQWEKPTKQWNEFCAMVWTMDTHGRTMWTLGNNPEF